MCLQRLLSISLSQHPNYFDKSHAPHRSATKCHGRGRCRNFQPEASIVNSGHQASSGHKRLRLICEHNGGQNNTSDERAPNTGSRCQTIRLFCEYASELCWQKRSEAPIVSHIEYILKVDSLAQRHSGLFQVQ